MATAPVRPRILAVDDNEQNRALVRAVLEDEDFVVQTAASGAEALAMLEQELPDCVLLDVRMPGMDGFAAADAIRRLRGGADLPLIFLTAARDLETFDRAMRAGGDDFVNKPVQPTELVMRVRAALKLRRVSAELREHYELVKRQRNDLMRLQLQKERLSAFVVHDLKNPINALDLHAQLLARNERLPSRARDSALRIRGEARPLLRMVMNLLDISRSEAGTLAPRREPLELRPLIEGVLDDFAVRAQQASVRLRAEGEVGPLHADGDLLRRVLENLVDNAIRHAPEATQVEVAVKGIAQSVEICVADDGPGIPSELRERVFDRFVQVGSERLVSRAGRGLGLAFCKLAVEAHGGSIRVLDRRSGTAFQVVLPR